MCALPRWIQLIAPRRWLAEVDTWFRKPLQYPISEISGKMIELAGNSFKPNDQEGDLIFKKLNN